jgi:hypothetical protein
MNPLQLAEIEQVYAVQYKEYLMIVAEGYTSGAGGSLHIWKSHTKVFPLLFEIYETPGDAGPNPSAEPTRVSAVAANVFHGRYNKIQVLHAKDRIFPKIILATEEELGPAATVEAGASAPELAGGLEQWIAVHEFAPPGPPKLRVEGIAHIPNLGVTPKLVRAKSQGANPKVLLLDIETETLTNVQGDLRWSKPVRIKVKYEEQTDYLYESVQIESIHKTIDMENVHRSPSNAKTREAGA